MPPKSRKDRKKKRKFAGNRYTGPIKKQKIEQEKKKQDSESDDTASNNDSEQSASFSKLRNTPSPVEFDKDDSLTGFRFVDLDLLIGFINTYPCTVCDSLEHFDVAESKQGLASTLTFTCMNCNAVKCLTTSVKSNTGCYEVNRRFPLSIFAIGKNYEQGRRFLANMNMPPPPPQSTWNKHKKKIHAATRTVALNSMNSALSEAKECMNSNDITVSCDGTWQKRGFSSKNGVATVLSVTNTKSNKVVDTETLSNYCTQCAIMKKKLNTEAAFEDWLRTKPHDCQQNHTGSAGAMEPEGMKRIFRRSLDRGARFTGYLGDGDSKSYASVANHQPPIYDKAITKLECTGHIQKRMGKRLMDKVAACKGKPYTDENGRKYSGIGGAGRLTSKAQKRIQGHYGAAIRDNKGDKEAMRSAIWAIYYHREGSHEHCGNWCQTKTGVGDASKNQLPKFVCDEIKPIFEQLSSDHLLDKCLHGGTQNSNESFHNMIWERCPKTTFVGRQRLELAVYDATISYNDGETGRLGIFQYLGYDPGYYTTTGLSDIDGKRIKRGYVAGQGLDARRRRALVHQRQRNDPAYQAGGHV